jgi:hypothetical protein
MRESEQRDTMELSFRLAMGPALLGTQGYASNAVANNYEAAKHLSDKLSDSEALFASTRGLWNLYYDRGDLDRSLHLAERLLEFANRDDRLEYRTLALRALGSARMSRAEFLSSQNAFEACISLSAGAPLGSCVGRHGEEPLRFAI